jgi:hypothetical protein
MLFPEGVLAAGASGGTALFGDFGIIPEFIEEVHFEFV